MIKDNNWAIEELKRIKKEQEQKKKREQEYLESLVENSSDGATLPPMGRN